VAAEGEKDLGGVHDVVGNDLFGNLIGHVQDQLGVITLPADVARGGADQDEGHELFFLCHILRCPPS
jgi:hypothetical protein